MLFFSFMGLFFGLAVKSSIYPIALYGVLITIFFTLFLYFHDSLTKYNNIGFIVCLMLFSLMAKVIAVFIFEKLMLDTSGIPFLSYRDDYVYNETSSNILNIWKQRGIGFYEDVYFSTGFYSGYPNISAFAKLIFGDHYLVPRFLNAAFSTLTIPVIYGTLTYLSNEKTHIKLITLIFAFSPIFIIYSALQFKDIILIFLLSTLVYGTVRYLVLGGGIAVMTVIVFSVAALLFFRAALVLPYLVALILPFLISKDSGRSKFKMLIWIALILITFNFIWSELFDAGILGLSADGYFESRFERTAEAESYNGSSNTGLLGLLGAFLAPIFILLSLFLPTPVYLDLDPHINTISYHYLPLLGYYSILPMVFISIIYLLNNIRFSKVSMFLLSFLFLYKMGQAGSKSIFDSRQSLPAIYICYLLLAHFNLSDHRIQELWDKYKIVIVFILLLVMFSFTFIRYIIRR